MKNYKFSILMPVYNGANVISETLETILRQDYANYEIIISDDCSTDKTEKVIKKIAEKNKRIKYFRNKTNLGYGNNMEQCRKLASKKSDLIFLMAQDDLLAKGVLKKINSVFNKYPEIGAIIRPFYMFADNFSKPIRDFAPFNRNKDTVLSIDDDEETLEAVFRTVCQLSGLAFKKDLIRLPFHQDIMTSHVYPFLDIFRRKKIMYLKDYTVAVRTYSSQCRTAPQIYKLSPTQAWLNLVNSVFKGEKYQKIRSMCIKIVLKNAVVGLIQIKNFSTLANLWREHYVIVRNRWLYLFDLRFLFYAAVSFLTPRFFLLRMVDFYKEKVLAWFIAKKGIIFVKA